MRLIDRIRRLRTLLSLSAVSVFSSVASPVSTSSDPTLWTGPALGGSASLFRLRQSQKAHDLGIGRFGPFFCSSYWCIFRATRSLAASCHSRSQKSQRVTDGHKTALATDSYQCREALLHRIYVATVPMIVSPRASASCIPMQTSHYV
jgi:hypothetical protein